jgi:hypothetical protein
MPNASMAAVILRSYPARQTHTNGLLPLQAMQS